MLPSVYILLNWSKTSVSITCSCSCLLLSLWQESMRASSPREVGVHAGNPQCSINVIEGKRKGMLHKHVEVDVRLVAHKVGFHVHGYVSCNSGRIEVLYARGKISEVRSLLQLSCTALGFFIEFLAVEWAWVPQRIQTVDVFAIRGKLACPHWRDQLAVAAATTKLSRLPFHNSSCL